ncbi:transcriptional repressor LexA [Silvanigrella aquatica]|uniref:Repressor LexA n=1 Tax=Silvanigrella aquatica TaxID=1915309 RepID=A0A1L4D050_9BACT|nr:transcriptional repressor LexA [Silvanigrella aquatica]APJ03575.1 repressor LexA [Silvanigrella aquatica]
MFELTKVQLNVLEFITKHMDSSGMPPTIREIATHFHWKAIGSAQDVIAALRKKGVLLSPAPGKSRQIVPTLEVTEYICKLKNSNYQLLSLRQTKKSKNEKAATKLNSNNFVTEENLFVPLVGSVKAGAPQEAIENPEEYIHFPHYSRVSLSKNKLFALEIDGFSMINAGFLPKDLVLVEAHPEPHDKDIVIASLQNGETTVKRFAKKDSPLYIKNLKYLTNSNNCFDPPAILVAENPEFSPLPFGLNEEDKIIGIVRSLYRKSIL